MRIAYVVTTYPHISHSFVRREIRALEAAGLVVERFSVRRTTAALADPADRSEEKSTRVLLDVGVIGLLRSVLYVFVFRPFSFVCAVVATIRLGHRSSRGLLRHIAYLAEACQLFRWIRSSDVKHFHAHFGTNPAAVAMLCHILSGLPFSFTVHGPAEFDEPEGFKLGMKIERASFVVAISEYTRSQLYRWCSPENWHKIHVVHCGVDDAFLTPESTSPPVAARLLCIGRLCEQKGQLVLIEATSKLRAEGISFALEMIGDGPMRAEIENLIQKHQLNDSVQMSGWKISSEVRESILAARALVLPSFAEGLPVVIMESFALQRPVISTYVAGTPELVESGVNGWLVPPGSVDRLAAAMKEAISAPLASLEEMGRRGREKVLKNHDVRVEAARLLALFHHSAGNARASSDRRDDECIMSPPATHEAGRQLQQDAI